MRISHRREIGKKQKKTYIPEFGAISRLSDIVVSLAMSTKIQNLVLDTWFGILIQFADVMLESLPLCLFDRVIKGIIRRVRLLNESKVLLCLFDWFVTSILEVTELWLCGTGQSIHIQKYRHQYREDLA